MYIEFDKETLTEHRKRFEELWRFYVEQFIDTLPQKEQDDAIEFLINLIGQEIVISDIKELLHNGDCDDRNHCMPLMASKHVPNCPLKGFNVIGLPSKRKSLLGAIRHILDEGFCKERDNYRVELYPEIRIAVAFDGKHHLSIAGVLDGAVADAEVYCLADVVDTLTTDGAYWYDTSQYGFKKPVEQVYIPEVAFLYELYRYKSCHKRTSLCVHCGCRTEYIVEPAPDVATIRGIQFKYTEQIPRCSQCGGEVYVADIHNTNVQTREEAFRKAKDLPGSI